MALNPEVLASRGPGQKKARILVVRPDRIGDVVLSTPVLEALKRAFPDAEIDLLVREAVTSVVEHNPYVSKIIQYKPETEHSGISGFNKLVHDIRLGNYDVVITLQVKFWVSAALLVARVPYRVGPYSKWFSYLMFNRGTRQNRSAVEMHETDYNLMLLRKLGVRLPSRKYEPTIMVDADAKERMRAYVKNIGIADATGFVVVHPGMGGSALNWPEGYYVDLVGRLAGRGIPIVVTGSIAEKALVERVISSALKERGEGLPISSFIGSNSPTGLSDMVALLSLAKVMVAPSTGPLHIAAALGKRTVSFYPPIRVQSAIRWGPYSIDDTRHTVLVPDALCGQDFKCAGRKCHFYFCMERLGVDEAINSVLDQLDKEKST